MPLSEEELRLLEQMERALVAEDPKFASTLRGTRSASTPAAAIIAGVVFVVGVTVLMSGAVLQSSRSASLGFVVMLASATYGLAVLRGQQAPPAAAAHADARATPRAAASASSRAAKHRRQPRPPSDAVHGALRGALAPSPRRDGGF